MHLRVKLVEASVFSFTLKIQITKTPQKQFSQLLGRSHALVYDETVTTCDWWQDVTIASICNSVGKTRQFRETATMIEYSDNSGDMCQ